MASNWNFNINSVIGFGYHSYTDSQGNTVKYWTQNKTSETITITGNWTRPSVFNFLDRAEIYLIIDNNNGEKVVSIDKDCELDTTGLGTTGTFEVKTAFKQTDISDLKPGDFVKYCRLQLYNRNNDMIGKLDHEIGYKVIDYVDAAPRAVRALNLTNNCFNEELKLEIIKPVLISGIEINGVIITVDGEKIDDEDIIVLENTTETIKVSLDTKDFASDLHTFKIFCANEQNKNFSILLSYLAVTYEKVTLLSKSFVELDYQLINSNLPLFDLPNNKYETVLSFVLDEDSEKYIGKIINSELNLQLKIFLTKDDQKLIIDIPQIDSLNIIYGDSSYFHYKIEEKTHVIIDNQEYTLKRALTKMFQDSIWGDGDGYVCFDTIELFAYDSFDNVVISTKESSNVDKAVKTKASPKWDGSSYKKIELRNEAENLIEFSGLPTLLQIYDKKDSCYIELSNAYDEQDDNIQLKYEYRINEQEWKTVTESSKKITISLDDIKVQDSKYGISEIEISVYPYYNNQDLKELRTIGEKIKLRYSIKPTITISEITEEELGKNSLPAFIFNKLGNLDNYNELVLDKEVLTDLTYAKNSTIIFKLGDKTYEYSSNALKEGEVFYPVTDDFKFMGETEYNIEISCLRNGETICTLSFNITTASFERPTIGHRKNGIIINGTPGQSLPEDEFIQINILEADKGIAFYVNDSRVGEIKYQDGKLHLSGFVID